MRASNQKPSLVLGLGSAWRLRRLVVCVWIVGVVLFVPASIILNRAVASVIGRLPDGFVAPAGEKAVLVMEATDPIVGPLWIVIATAMLLGWFFAVLWHAGVARFEVWGQGAPAVSKIVGLGLTAWWRYFRLSLTALTVLMALLLAAWIPVVAGVTAAFQAMAEERMVLLIGVGLAGGVLIKFVVWAATLRGAWELASPTRRSAVMAWFLGLGGIFRSPVATVGTLLVFGVAEVGLVIAPLAVPWLVPVLRGSFGGAVFGVAAGLGAAYCSVALYCAFAPVSGLAGTPDMAGEEPPSDAG